MNKPIIGIDPGTEGALVLLKPDGIMIMDVNNSVVDAINWMAFQKEKYPDVCACIESVHSMPKQGVSSTFKFGFIYGSLRGALIALKIPIVSEPPPQTWKKNIFGSGFSKYTKAIQKIKARDKARELYPMYSEFFSRFKDADRAEALLLAVYGLRLVNG